MDDLISRQAAIDLLKQMRKDGDMIPWEGKDVFARIRKLPSAQPNYAELAQTVERWYNKALTKPYIENPLAWALEQSLEGVEE